MDLVDPDPEHWFQFAETFVLTSVADLQHFKRFLLRIQHFTACISRVVDPDPDWIRIQSGLDPDSGIRIRIQEGKKVHVLKCWMASFEN